MILKGNQRGNGGDLAVHLMNAFDNESIEVAEIYGAVSEDLLGAFAEFEAVSLGTRAKEYLYSLSINPPSPLTREQYAEAIGLIEERLGLSGQPRAVVFHEKRDESGVLREHCHVVWSRTNVEKMRAVHMAHDRSRLMDLAVELSRKIRARHAARSQGLGSKTKARKGQARRDPCRESPGRKDRHHSRAAPRRNHRSLRAL